MTDWLHRSSARRVAAGVGMPSTELPRIEALLSALAADAPYRDAILGDLAEEFAIRVEEQGEREARRWYRRQALRTAPHLLRLWARRLCSFDIAQLVAFTLLAQVAGGVINMAVRAAIVMSYGVSIDDAQVVNIAWRDLTEWSALPTRLISLSVAAVSLFGAGYVLSRLERRAPLATCIVVGSVLSLETISSAIYGSAVPTWAVCAFAAISVMATVAGGVFGIVRYDVAAE
ncbi:MAG TPA: hypothetical protein VGM82_19120 [Gemmatimonadaceae bacterium]|jgi:hypothetical protein